MNAQENCETVVDAEENSADCETVVDAEENSADCETVVDAEENRAVRLLCCRGEQCCFATVVNAEENSAAVRLLWMQRRTVL